METPREIGQHEVVVDEHLDEEERAAIWNPDVGEGTPDTAPLQAVFDDDDELDPGGEDGHALDDDDQADD